MAVTFLIFRKIYSGFSELITWLQTNVCLFSSNVIEKCLGSEHISEASKRAIISELMECLPTLLVDNFANYGTKRHIISYQKMCHLQIDDLFSLLCFLSSSFEEICFPSVFMASNFRPQPRKVELMQSELWTDDLVLKERWSFYDEAKPIHTSKNPTSSNYYHG